MGELPGFLQSIASLPPWLMYAVIGVGAAIENFVPPVPADTFVLLGAFLSAHGDANPWLVFLFTWSLNVGAAIAVYELAARHGERFFATRLGRMLMNEKQLAQVGRFYQRWGTPAIFVSRFLPAFRAVVPVFGGVTRVPLLKFAVPAAIASAIWYGGLVYLGAAAGRNWSELMAFFDRFSTVLVAIAAILGVVFGWWWWKSRRAA